MIGFDNRLLGQNTKLRTFQMPLENYILCLVVNYKDDCQHFQMVAYLV